MFVQPAANQRKGCKLKKLDKQVLFVNTGNILKIICY